MKTKKGNRKKRKMYRDRKYLIWNKKMVYIMENTIDKAEMLFSDMKKVFQYEERDRKKESD